MKFSPPWFRLHERRGHRCRRLYDFRYMYESIDAIPCAKNFTHGNLGRISSSDLTGSTQRNVSDQKKGQNEGG